MGNCLRRDGSMEWAGDDWECVATEGRKGKGGKLNKKQKEEAEDGLLQNDRGLSSFSTSSSSPKTDITKVKIKITKKQLEELLGKVDITDLSVHQVLAQLIKVSDRFESHQRSWRPALQSIPEVN